MEEHQEGSELTNSDKGLKNMKGVAKKAAPFCILNFTVTIAHTIMN